MSRWPRSLLHTPWRSSARRPSATSESVVTSKRTARVVLGILELEVRSRLDFFDHSYLFRAVIPGLELAYVRGQVPRRPPDAPRLPDHRRDRAGRRGAEPLHGRARDRDAAADRVLPRCRLLHLP